MMLRSLRTKLLVLWILFATLLVAVTNFIAFCAAVEAQFQQLRQTLTAIATTAALQVDGDLHGRIPLDPTSVTLPDYQTLVTQLRTIRDAHPTIRYVYTLVPSETPGVWRYVGDAEERRISFPGERYEAARYPSMIAGLQGPSADPNITMDEWGALLSGYAPIKDASGRVVGVLGIDMSGEHVLRTQAEIRRWRFVILVLGLCMAVIFGARLAQWFSRPIRLLVQGTQRIGEGDLQYRVPIMSKDEVGVLAQSFNQMAQRLADSLQRLKDHVFATLQSLAAALEAKDLHTRGHSERVTFYATKIARHMGLPAEEVELISQFSRMHDIGKIGIKEDILNKPAKLTPEEFDHIKRHSDLGYKILVPLKPPSLALEIVRHHHERQDGGGYPDRIAGEQIPLAVAIVTVADAFDGMTAFRPYRPQPMTFQEAVEELRRCTGTQFHPKAVEAMIEVLRKDGKL